MAPGGKCYVNREKFAPFMVACNARTNIARAKFSTVGAPGFRRRDCRSVFVSVGVDVERGRGRIVKDSGNVSRTPNDDAVRFRAMKRAALIKYFRHR